ncbi:MAG: hypothetical protein FJ405_08040 [Verrucomicrobia bacterium]|nr:hypothetical protein [Verrucomicrobiota bacterium]
MKNQRTIGTIADPVASNRQCSFSQQVLTSGFLGLALLITGCAGYRVAERHDAYENVRVDELSGNKVSRGVFDRRTLWLNARREVRKDLSRDYYLITELTPSADFTPQSTGETLVLLIDGVRHGYATTNTLAAFKGRSGIITSVYKVPGETLVKIANAQDLRVRIKGVSGVLDEQAPPSVMENFRKWLVEKFTPDQAAPTQAHNPTQHAQ